MSGKYFSLVNSSVRYFKRATSSKNHASFFLKTHINEVQPVVRLQYHTSTLCKSSKDETPNHVKESAEILDNKEVEKPSLSADKAEKDAKNVDGNLVSDEIQLKEDITESEKSKESLSEETVQKTVEGEENVVEPVVKVKTTKAKRAGKKKKAKSAYTAPESLVKKVSKELHPKEVTQQKNVEIELLTQLLKIDKKTDKMEGLADMSTRSLFDNVSTPRNNKKLSSLFDKVSTSQKNKKSRSTTPFVRRLNYFKVTKDSIDPQTARKRPENKSEWTATDWFNDHQDKLDENLFDVPYPSNAFEEQIKWTEEGKLWKFPIDNEQGINQVEVNTPFYKHIFLESKLDDGDWCPKSGAVRDFMSSLCTALSMNPYLSVEEKHQHIDWFRDYFHEKSDLMSALGLTAGSSR